MSESVSEPEIELLNAEGSSPEVTPPRPPQRNQRFQRQVIAAFTAGLLLIVAAIVLALSFRTESVFGVEQQTVDDLSERNIIAATPTTSDSTDIADYWNSPTGGRLMSLLELTETVDAQNPNCESYVEGWERLTEPEPVTFPDAGIGEVIEGYELAALRLRDACTSAIPDAGMIAANADTAARSHTIMVATLIASGTDPA